MSKRYEDKKRNVSIENIEFGGGNPMSGNSSVPSPPPPQSRLSANLDTYNPRKGRNSRNEEKTSKRSSNNAQALEEGNGSSVPRPPPPAPPTPVAAASKEKKEKTVDPEVQRFTGKHPIMYGVWAHYMSYGSSLICFWLGITAILWDHPTFYKCEIDGSPIYSGYLKQSNGTCEFMHDGKYICCDPDHDKLVIQGFTELGLLYIFYSIFILFIENTYWGFGLYFPNDTFIYRSRISPWGVLHIIIGVAGLASYATCLGGGALIINGIVYNIATIRHEVGDGGRLEYKKKNKDKSLYQQYYDHFNIFKLTNPDEKVFYTPVEFIKKIYNEDRLSSYFWVGCFYILNISLFIYTVNLWYNQINEMRTELVNGNMNVICSSKNCRFHRQLVRSGPLSFWAAWAKGCGNLLNLNCAVIIMPVTRLILRQINNAGADYNEKNAGGNIFSRFLARPITRYIPLSKNIEFHKICAFNIFFFTTGHIIFHCLNLISASETTLARFRDWGWAGTDLFTGALVTLAMFFIYTAAPDSVRHASYEIFFISHQWMIVFYLALFLHGPVFVYWAILPFLMYCYERYLQMKKGNNPFLITKVEWIPPVLAVQFRPLFKEHFVFKEGQYLYLNCPHISKTEWHPFTISSAFGDMDNGPRICLETGEEVFEVPRPADWPKGGKWNKYCLVSQDYRKIPHAFLLDKHETGYNDYVSVHIKVIGLDDRKAISWTRKFKEYLELMNPSVDGEVRFPFYFSRRDARGDITIGRQFGPDGQQIIRVDGPHAAPAEHYVNYGTVMLIGAGIGLTPCVSILTALTRYRWKKNFTPEILHFYWVVRHNEVGSFQWLIHSLTELEYDLKKARQTRNIDGKYICQVHIFITAAPKDIQEHEPLYRPNSIDVMPVDGRTHIVPSFTAEELYDGCINPTVSSKGMIQYQRDNKDSKNRFQDIWVWNGRPMWDEIFKDMKDNRQHSDIGVCFCGTPVIGADLRSMCEKYSSAEDDILFSLHKENF